MNSSNKLTLLLNFEKIVIESPVVLNELATLDYAKIIFVTIDKKYVLHNEEIGAALERLCQVMNEALQGKIPLPNKFKKKDIGYFYNQGLYSLPVAKRIEKSNEITCFFLWGSPCNIDPNLETWLYNDEQGNIIFHVTENFRRDNSKLIKDQKAAYKEFMQKYKPVLVRIIPRDIAQEWVNQWAALFEVCVTNVPKFIEKNNLWTFKINLGDVPSVGVKKKSKNKENK